MHAFQTAASAFCIACICAEITTLLVGAGWAGRCIKAVAGLYILVILFRRRLLRQRSASRVRRHRSCRERRNGWKQIFAQSVSGALVQR